jgi:glycosyltransferase involved in cell wall biosynthesis
MRVLFIVGHGGIYAGGAHQSLYALIGLKKAGIEIASVWGEDAESDRGGFKRLTDLGAPHWFLRVNQKPSVASALALRKIIKEFRPDVIEAVKSGAQYHILAAGLGLEYGLVFYRGISRPMEWGQALKYRLKRVNRLIANCNDLREIMVNSGGIGPAKIDVIPGEFDPACADPERVDTSGLRRELNIPAGVPLITQLGNHAEWRGQKYTLEAAAQLAAGGVRFHLLFAGRETEKLQPLVEQLHLEKFVTLSKYRRDPERLLKESSVAVNSSIGNESLPGAVINAQAMGVPGVVTSMPGARDIVEDGVTGFLVPPRDSKSLAEAIGTILQMPSQDYQRMRKEARAHAVRLFSSERRAQSRIECYEKAIDAARK